jgi:hypothetical protein
MNDFMEMHWGYYIWEQAAGEVLETVGKDFLDDIDSIIHTSGVRVLPLAACFSRQGDVLSQWRAYGADGSGYAIGFNASMLVQLPNKALKVEYDRKKQVKEVKDFILALHNVEEAEEHKRGPDFFRHCATLAIDLSSYKNPAFVEEDEIRLIHLLNFQSSNSTLKLEDAGGQVGDQMIAKQEVKFRIKQSTPVPYLDMDFEGMEKKSSIAEVILGPKNDSLMHGISVFLETLGHGNVEIKKSAASYR